MKLKTLAVILLCAVSAFAGTFTSPAGRFSADFIADPTVTTQDVKTAKGGTVTITSFFAKAADKSMGENIDYVDFPEPLTQQQLLDTAKAAFEDKTLDGVGKTESDGRTWVLVAGHDDELLYFYAETCVGKRLYTVTIAAPMTTEEKGRVAETAAEAFLGSIKITE